MAQIKYIKDLYENEEASLREISPTAPLYIRNRGKGLNIHYCVLLTPHPRLSYLDPISGKEQTNRRYTGELYYLNW